MFRKVLSIKGSPVIACKSCDQHGLYWRPFKAIFRSIGGYNPYINLFIITIDYSKKFTTRLLLTIGHMSMFVVKSIVIKINGLGDPCLGYGSINTYYQYTIHYSITTKNVHPFSLNVCCKI